MGNVIPPTNWSFSYTISPPAILRLTYQPKGTASNPSPSERTVDLTSTDESMTHSLYERFEYFSEIEQTGYTEFEGKPQVTDVLVEKEEIKRTTQAAVAQNYVVDRLSRGAGLPSGDAITRTVTYYEYLPTTDGPFLYKETTETYITMAELAGGLDIPTYEFYDPGVAVFLSTVREVLYEKRTEWQKSSETNSDLGTETTSSYKRESTKTETSTWIANGLRDFGKQGFAEAMKQLESIAFDPERSNELISTMVEYMTELIFEGTEIQIEIGKGEYGFETNRLDRPDLEKLPESDPNDSGYDPDDPYEPVNEPVEPRSLRSGNSGSQRTERQQTQEQSGKRCFRGVIQFQNVPYISSDDTQTANYEMPFAPDDYLFVHGNKRKLIRNNARLAAEEYAITESLMDIGHAFGQNIVTGFGDIPTLELSPVYVRLADVEGAFLLDALSYAWDSNGLVVSSDLMLVGVTGYYGSTPPATSWLRLPVSSLGLPAAGNPIIGTGSKANSIAIPTGFNPLNLTPVLAALPSNGVDTYAVKHNTATIIGPVLRREQYYIGIRIGTATVDYSYALFLFEEYVTQVRVGVTFSESYLILVPSVNGYSITANPPIFTTGKAIAVPSTVITVAPEVPTVDKFTTVNVPATVVYVAGNIPEKVGDISLIIDVPTSIVQVAAIAPDKAGDASLIVAVPVATIQVAAVAPDRAGEDATKVLVPAAVVDVAAIAPQVVAQALTINVPTAETILLTGQVPQVNPGDPFMANVSLLLPLDGADNSTTFTDASSNNFAMTRFGNAVISTTDPKYGTGSLLLANAGDYISTPADSAFAFGTGDFTVECHCLFTSASNNGLFTFGQLALSVFGGNWWLSTTGSGGTPMGPHMAANTWAFVRVTRTGTSLRLFVDDAQVGSTLTNTTNLTGNVCSVGMYFSAAYTWLGKIDNFRITKGVARTDAPPTGPFPTSTGASLYLSFDGTVGSNTAPTDLSGNNLAVTIQGTQTRYVVSNTQAKYAEAGFFDFLSSLASNNVRLQIAGTSLLSFPGDFELQLWFWMTSKTNVSFATLLELGQYTNGIMIRHGSDAGVYINSTALAVTAVQNLALSTWHHIAVCRIGTTAKVYINGVESASATVSGTINSTSGQTFIGDSTHFPNRFFSGYIDDLRILKGKCTIAGNFTPAGPLG